MSPLLKELWLRLISVCVYAPLPFPLDNLSSVMTVFSPLDVFASVMVILTSNQARSQLRETHVDILVYQDHQELGVKVYSLLFDSFLFAF